MMKSFQWLLSTIIQYILTFYEYCHQLIQKYFTGKVITFDSGKRVMIGKQIAEGGFSYIFLAYDAANVSQQQRQRTKFRPQPQQQQQYALKRIHCPDIELIDRCRYEADVHRDVMKHNCSYVMPLYGFTIIQHDCYMLFPLCTESLRDFINRKNPYLTPSHPHPPHHHPHRTTSTTSPTTTTPPISEVMVLQLFRQICYGVQALHTCGYSHRDIKIENVMILSNDEPTLHITTTNGPSSLLPHLVIMDFGSAGPIDVTIHNRKQILEMIEQASQHTTMPYRPPELFDGGIRLPPTTTSTTNTTTVLDYRAVDVWSLGCTLHAIMYGVSPFECEFNVATSSSSSSTTTTHYTHNATTTMGNIKIVDCTHLSILGNIPVPKYSPISSWYSDSIRNELLLPMLRQEPNERPKLEAIIQTIEGVIVQLGGAIMNMPPSMDNDSNSNSSNNNRYSDHHQYRDDVGTEDEDTDGIALLSRMA